MNRRHCVHALTIVTAGQYLAFTAFVDMPQLLPASLLLTSKEIPAPIEQMIASDPLYAQAVAIVMANRKASISLVQRHLRLGYNRAASLLRSMEKSGLISGHYVNGYRLLLN